MHSILLSDTVAELTSRLILIAAPVSWHSMFCVSLLCSYCGRCSSPVHFMAADMAVFTDMVWTWLRR